ncbi:MAG: glycosyltransferase [Gemmatimonadaceae bacterium]|nr:glycosyltransferase [Gemmatimonadaceae bacterium]
MSEPITVSVIIDTFEQGPFVAAAVASALAQRAVREGQGEVIVVDDGSTDRTPEILAGFASAIQVIRQPNGGQAAALNRGIAGARGTWLAFLDGDDEWGPEYLDAALSALESSPDCDAGFSGVLTVDAAGRPLGQDPSPLDWTMLEALLRESDALGAGRVSWMPPTSGLCVRRSLLAVLVEGETAGPVPAQYRIAADGWLQLCIASHARRVVPVGGRHVRLRVHGANRWTGADEFSAPIAQARASLYAELGRSAESLASKALRDISGLRRALRANAGEFGVWAAILAGQRVRALGLALVWRPAPWVTSTLHRAFRRLQLVLATVVPVGVYRHLRALWRGRHADAGTPP